MMDTFESGYTKALLDVLNFFEDHSYALSHYRMFKKASVIGILKFLLDNRVELRETGTVADVLCVRGESKLKKIQCNCDGGSYD